MDYSIYIGQQINQWTILDVAPPQTNSRGDVIAMLRCQCSCGTIKDVNANNLVRGRSKSCGKCKTHKYVGMQLGNLTIVDYAGAIEMGQNEYVGSYKAICSCGKERIVTTSEITKRRVYACKECTQRNKKNHIFNPLRNDEREKVNRIPAESLIGMKFGHLTVLRIVEKPSEAKTKDRSIWFLCCCDCGNTKIVKRSDLVGKIVTSCGCKKRSNLVGQVFGKLTVMRDTGLRNKSRKVMYECLCECGNTCVTSSDSLLAKTPQTSCGCLSSRGELKIIELLQDMKCKFQTQQTFANCKSINKLRFDFYLPDFNLLIEFDGKQHFYLNQNWSGKFYTPKTYEHDLLKEEYCIECHKALLRIPYTEYEKLNSEYIMQLINNAIHNHKNGQIITYVNKELYDNRAAEFAQLT